MYLAAGREISRPSMRALPAQSETCQLHQPNLRFSVISYMGGQCRSTVQTECPWGKYSEENRTGVSESSSMLGHRASTGRVGGWEANWPERTYRVGRSSLMNSKDGYGAIVLRCSSAQERRVSIAVRPDKRLPGRGGGPMRKCGGWSRLGLSASMIDRVFERSAQGWSPLLVQPEPIGPYVTATGASRGTPDPSAALLSFSF